MADGTSLGPLHGVPFTVKENIDLAGTPTTHAIPALAEAVAAVDAPQVERLRTAGAIPLGRTNLPDFGLRVHTDSALHGLTRNPWNPQRTAGGSSGGEAAALATGVLARRVADVRAAFTVMAGQHPRDPLSVPAVFTDLAPVFLDYALGYLPESDVAAWAMAHTARHGLARRWSLWYQEYPVLLSPVWSQPAFPLGFDIASLDNAIATLELMRPVLPANLLGTPAAVVPAGMADGLPVGVQVMGGKYTELRCLAVAEAIEQRLGTLTPINPVAD